MHDQYAPPRAPVDVVLQTRSWKNAAIALASGSVGTYAIMFAILATDGRDPGNAAWDWRTVMFLLVAALPFTALALCLPRLRWYLVAMLAPVLSFLVALALLLVEFVLERI